MPNEKKIRFLENNQRIIYIFACSIKGNIEEKYMFLKSYRRLFNCLIYYV